MVLFKYYFLIRIHGVSSSASSGAKCSIFRLAYARREFYQCVKCLNVCAGKNCGNFIIIFAMSRLKGFNQLLTDRLEHAIYHSRLCCPPEGAE